MLKTVRVPEKLTPLFELAQTYVSRYFSDQKAAPERGTVEICGQRYVLVRAASMSVEFYEMVRNLYGEEEQALAVAHGLLFDVAHAMGLADARSFAERMEVADPIARLSAGPVHFAHAGWAFVDISAESSPVPDENYYLLYDHPYSFESDSWLMAHKPSTHPVCVMNAGYSSGWCEHSFGLPLVAVEILCRAKGDEACRFIMAPPSRVEERIARYAERHPELAPRMVNLQVPGFFAKRTDQQLLRQNLELERRVEQRARELSAINERLERDIAERRRTEAALSASKELVERLIEVLPGGVVQVSKEGAILSANAEALRILALDYDELTRRYVRDWEPETIFEDGSAAHADDYPVVKALRTGEPQPALTLGLKRPNGEVSWAAYRAVALRDPATQEITGAVVTLFDINERKRFEDKLRHTQKLESLGVLTGGIAHDFNNLLVTILGNTSLARSIAGPDPGLATALEEIELGARRAAELVKQMLDYSGQSKVAVGSLDVPALVRETSKFLTALIPKRVELHYRLQERLPAVEADATQIRQVLMNLVINAAESLGERAGRVVISAEARYVSQNDLDQLTSHAAKPGTFLRLAVEDDGCGMSEDTLKRIFDPFFTTKFQGRGLGMAAVLGIVRGHSGAIQIASQEGAGTQVQVFLPARSAPRVAAPIAERGTILIVDDDEGVQSFARRVLMARGYQVLSAWNGLEGVRTYEEHRDEVRLIVMDLTMPQMGGVEALRQIRERGGEVPVLLSSGYLAGSEAEEFAGFLEKPYDHRELVAAIERVIGTASE